MPQQFSGGAFSHVAGAEKNDILAGERPAGRTEDQLRELDCGMRSRDEMRNEFRLLADAPADGQSLAQHGIEMASGGAGIPRLLPGDGELARDVAFANVHGIEAAADSEGVGKGLFIQEAIKAVPLLELEVVFRGEESQNGIDGKSGIAPEDEFGAIRSREYYDLVDALGLRQHR